MFWVVGIYKAEITFVHLILSLVSYRDELDQRNVAECMFSSEKFVHKTQEDITTLYPSHELYLLMCLYPHFSGYQYESI